MIASISGEISQILDDSIVLNVGGVGLLINLTKETCHNCRVGGKKYFHTHLVVREDHLALFGFETKKERDLFIHLISVAGVGPKTGLAILSTLTPDMIRRAITADQPEIFSRVSGVGKKTAQKIILHLQGQIEPLEPLESSQALDELDAEVLEALTALGYSVVEAQSALQSIPADPEMDAEERLRKALQYFS